jgi:hypothetical protein
MRGARQDRSEAVVSGETVRAAAEARAISAVQEASGAVGEDGREMAGDGG